MRALARIRSIHPDACRSRKLSAISAEAERLYWRLQTECDDEGRAEDDPQLLWAACVPLVVRVTADRVEKWLDELARVGLLTRYAIGEQRLLQVTRWSVYQHPKKATPSRYPPPPAEEKVGEQWGTRSPPVGPGEERRGEEKERSVARGSAAPVRGNSFSTRLAELLMELLRPVPGARIPHGARARWANEIEALVRETPELQAPDAAERVEAMIRYALGPENLGQEYEVVVRSGRALREKWSKLVARQQRQRGAGYVDLAAYEAELEGKVQ